MSKRLASVFDTTTAEAKPLMLPDQGIPLCVICGSAFEALADEMATQRTNELRDQVKVKLELMSQTVDQLVHAVNNLQRVAHHH